MATDVLIIAEAGVNHNGSLALAKELVHAAREAGADIVKFQTFKADKLVTVGSAKADYQIKNTSGSESQYEMLKKLELSFDEFLELADYCKNVGIEFLSTAFDEESLDFLLREKLIQRIKVPSGEMTNAPLLRKFGVSGLPIILSTGMCRMDEIQAAIDLLEWSTIAEGPPFREFQRQRSSAKSRSDIQILHCTTEYPAPIAELNLRAMEHLATHFGRSVGYSDHSEGILAPLAATALGACTIEKHFTLDRKMAGPDHRASLEPQELTEMVKGIRTIKHMLGAATKAPTTTELKNAPIARKSIAAQTPIRQGELFSEQNLTTKRPGTGVNPFEYWTLIGKPAMKNYEPDELISQQEIS